ncbi:CBO0543 family protein [Neobacillus sp. PS2-9]|uniref:CBO0543 family protein n=1 Tax=Neobacillus sp. PS2-9 TaxID=3070676 RepID=UPI0027DEB029|nr:CBO0543 family protein [Neobacillus sp. PS2-9]WML56476.1 CBO0543 family protein [Neobacillus sp. PS2-9]
MHSTSGMHKSFWEYHQAYDHRMNSWKQEVLFTWQWWLGIALTIIPIVLWVIFRNRESTDRLLYSGFFVCLVSVTADNIGVQLSFWNYLRPVTPAIPSYLPFDFSLMPISVMFLIQFFHNRNPWFIGIVFGILTAFVGEPFFKWLGIYEPTNWKFGFSIPLYSVIYVSAHKLATRKKFKRLN